MLQAAVADPAIVARYSMKTTGVPGSPCLWWTGAVSARGHGRFWLGEVGGRDVVVIAHRFGWALEHGVAALGEALVLGHRCDNPLCQQLGVGHVQLSSHTANRQEWPARRHALGNPLRDGRGSRGRSRAIRDILRREGTPRALAAAAAQGLRCDPTQLNLGPEFGHRLGHGADELLADSR
ncbi:MAG: hypothetical protein M3486_03700 [Actinomycetota bacterium]|nr:hypothetical protein [Actinomycetota bacterium]